MKKIFTCMTPNKINSILMLKSEKTKKAFIESLKDTTFLTGHNEKIYDQIVGFFVEQIREG